MRKATKAVEKDFYNKKSRNATKTVHPKSYNIDIEVVLCVYSTCWRHFFQPEIRAYPRAPKTKPLPKKRIGFTSV